MGPAGWMSGVPVEGAKGRGEALCGSGGSRTPGAACRYWCSTGGPEPRVFALAGISRQRDLAHRKRALRSGVAAPPRIGAACRDPDRLHGPCGRRSVQRREPERRWRTCTGHLPRDAAIGVSASPCALGGRGSRPVPGSCDACRSPRILLLRETGARRSPASLPRAGCRRFPPGRASRVFPPARPQLPLEVRQRSVPCPSFRGHAPADAGCCGVSLLRALDATVSDDFRAC